MKTITLNIDDSIYEKFLSLIGNLPKEKISLVDEIDEIRGTSVDVKEHREIEEIIKKPGTKVTVKTKTLKL